MIDFLKNLLYYLIPTDDEEKGIKFLDLDTLEPISKEDVDKE